MWARLRELLPLAARQSVAGARRSIADRRAGFVSVRARNPEAGAWRTCVEVTQEIRGADPIALRGKLANLARAAACFDGLCLRQGESASFWAVLGRPTVARGYAAGRNLVGGRVVHEAGGGLCQASGILYHLALEAGLEVTERHAHSVDLYHDAERVTPLGADATVVWGYKDLRFKNPHPDALVVRLRTTGTSLVAGAATLGDLHRRAVRFEVSPHGHEHVRVRTLRDEVVLTTSTYLQRPGLQAHPTDPQKSGAGRGAGSKAC